MAHPLDRQTDGWICYNSIAICMHCMLTRYKNETASMIDEIG